MMMRPPAPRVSCFCVSSCLCGWYQYVPAWFLTVNTAVVHVVPAAMGWCGPPSERPFRSSPCQCVVVSSLKVLRTDNCTGSPLFRSNVGPQKLLPLYPYVLVAGPAKNCFDDVPSVNS